MESIFFEANKRGYAKQQWLESYFSFSFASYYNPKNMNFGVLRVLNDDIIDCSNGFGMHPHDNMEIITIPLSGTLKHKDNTGNEGVIEKGDVQVMSAGTGILHSEFNPSATEPSKLLQLWILPNSTNVTPRYDQKKYNIDDRKNKLQCIVSPRQDKKSLWIHQDAWLYLCDAMPTISIAHTAQKKGNGFYVFVLEGSINVINKKLLARDAIGILNTTTININANEQSSFLLIDLPIS